MRKLIKLTILILLFNHNSFSQVDNLTFQFLRKVVEKGDTISLKATLSKSTIPVNSIISSDGISLLTKEYFNKSKPFIHYIDYKSGNRDIFFLFDIQYLPYYLKEGLKTVNKNKVKTFVWAYNDDLQLNEKEYTVLHFYPVTSKGNPINRSEMTICEDKVLLLFSYFKNSK